MSWMWRSFSSSGAKPPRKDDDDEEFEDAPAVAPAQPITRAATIGMVPPRASAEVIPPASEDSDGKPGNDKDEVVSIRAPLSVIDDEDDEEEEDADGPDDDFVSTAEKAESSASNRSGASFQSVGVPVAKITAEAEDFNLPAKVGSISETVAVVGEAAVGSENEDDGIVMDGIVPAEQQEQQVEDVLALAVSSEPKASEAEVPPEQPAEIAPPVPDTTALIPAEEAPTPTPALKDEDTMEVETIEEGNGVYAEDDDDEEDEDDEDEDDEDASESLQALVAAMEADIHRQQQGGLSNGQLAAMLQGGGEQGGASSGGPSLPLRAGGGGGSGGAVVPAGAPAAPGSSGQPAGMRAMPAAMQSMLEVFSRAQGGAIGGAGAAAAGAPAEEEEETEMGRKLTELRVKLFRFARRMGQNESNPVVAQVLYRLDLAERLQGVGRATGRMMGSASRMERVRALAEELEAQEGANAPLDFEVTVMLIGKGGVGKTATIQNLLGLPFGPNEAKPTKEVKLTVNTVHGVTFRMIEVPGLHPAAANAGKNLKTLRNAKKFLGKKPPDAVLYVDRLDWAQRDMAGDLELVKPISEVFGQPIWNSFVGLLTHGGASPPEDDQGRVMSYEIYVAHRSHAVQNTMRAAAGDVRLANPVVLAENHPECRTIRSGDKILPNGQAWRPHVLLTCLAGRCLADGHELLQKSGGGQGAVRPMPMRQRLPPLAFLLSNLLQKRAPVKLPAEQGMGDEEDDDLWDEEDNEEEVDFDQLPPFRRLSNAELDQLAPAQRNEYHQELAEREKLFQKKQWREELLRRKELRKLAEEEERKLKGASGGAKEQKGGAEEAAAAAAAAEEDDGPSNVPVPQPEMDIPLSFDSDHPSHRYRQLQSESEWMLRPVSELNGWDHDVGFNTFQVEKSAALFNSKRLPAYFNAQVEKDKKDCAVQLEAGTSLRHGASFPGSTPVTTVSLDMQLAGKEHRMGTVRADARFGLLRHNKLGIGCSFTKYPDMALIPGVKIEDSHNFGKRVSVVAAAGLVKHGRYVARGLSFEGQLKPADHPVGRNLHQVGLSLLDWQGDLVIGANASSQLQLGNTTVLQLRGNINNRAAGTISVRCSSSEHMQLAAVALIPLLRYFLGGGFLFRKREAASVGGGDAWQG